MSLSPIVKGPFDGSAGLTPRVQSVVCKMGVNPVPLTLLRLNVPFSDVQELYRLAHSLQFAGSIFGDSAKVDASQVDWVSLVGCHEMPVEFGMSLAADEHQPGPAKQRTAAKIGKPATIMISSPGSGLCGLDG